MSGLRRSASNVSVTMNPSHPRTAFRAKRGLGQKAPRDWDRPSGKSDLADPGPHRASGEAAGTDHAAGRARGARNDALTSCIWAPFGAKARRGYPPRNLFDRIFRVAKCSTWLENAQADIWIGGSTSGGSGQT
jgi:hypothetical protein